MSSEAKERDEIDRLYQRLLLREEAPTRVADEELEVAYRRARVALAADLEWTHHQHFELRLRMALHLAPRAAIAFNPAAPQSRRRLIEDYLIRQHGRSPADASDLARHIARVLNAWDENREIVSLHVDELYIAQSGRCAHCRVSVLNRSGSLPKPTPASLRHHDVFKPLHLAPEELLSPEVDHIEPVSRLGRNMVANLQLLCRFCNGGKGDRLGVDIRREAQYAGAPIASIPPRLRAELHYYTLARDERACRYCDDRSRSELTIRLINDSGGYIRSNLHTVCVECINWHQPK